MASLRLEDIWRQRLTAMNWPMRAISQYPSFLAAETIKTYNRRSIQKFHDFCVDQGHTTINNESAVLVAFMCQIADGSVRPQSQLNCMLAALSHLFQALNITDTTHNIAVRNMFTALVKSGTQNVRKHSSVMPTQPFRDTFLAWPDNNLLDIKKLRLKSLTLLALTLMLRPSDVAPRGFTFDTDLHVMKRMTFTTNNIQFMQDGSATIWFHGTKNDIDRAGFEVHIPPASNSKLDPVNTLRTYINRTAINRPPNGAVFLGLKAPYNAITHGTVSHILSEAIQLVGLDPKKYKARDFRPTGATVQVTKGFDPDLVMRVGRWKTRSVFFEHYVHAKPPDTYVNQLLDI